MPYPTATEDDVAFFQEHGWIAVHDAVDPADLVTLEERCQKILDRKETMAFDWAWEKGQEKDERQFKILQSSPTMFWPEINDEPFRAWAVRVRFGAHGTRARVLVRPVPRQAAGGVSVPTRWHQDEGYWGRLLDDRGITCWMPFHDVDPSNGCMHFIDGGHRDGVLEHANAAEVQSDLLECAPDESRPSRARSSSAASRSTTARHRT